MKETAANTAVAARKYLSQVSRLEFGIKARRGELKRLKADREGISGIDYERIKVDSSAAGTSAPERFVICIDERERDIIEKIDELQTIRSKIIEQTEQLPTKYSWILYKRYIEHKRMDAIANEMFYSLQYTSKQHTAALVAFGDMFLGECTMSAIDSLTAPQEPPERE